MAHIDDADLPLRQAIQNWLDMGSLQAENTFHAPGLSVFFMQYRGEDEPGIIAALWAAAHAADAQAAPETGERVDGKCFVMPAAHRSSFVFYLELGVKLNFWPPMDASYIKPPLA